MPIWIVNNWKPVLTAILIAGIFLFFRHYENVVDKNSVYKDQVAGYETAVRQLEDDKVKTVSIMETNHRRAIENEKRRAEALLRIERYDEKNDPSGRGVLADTIDFLYATEGD